MERKIAIAARRYLELHDPSAERLGHTDNFEVYNAVEGVVFLSIKDSWDDFDQYTLRKQFEDEMEQWFRFHDELADVPVRCDVIGIKVIGSDRAIIKHCVNACGKVE